MFSRGFVIVIDKALSAFLLPLSILVKALHFQNRMQAGIGLFDIAHINQSFFIAQ